MQGNGLLMPLCAGIQMWLLLPGPQGQAWRASGSSDGASTREQGMAGPPHSVNKL